VGSPVQSAGRGFSRLSEQAAVPLAEAAVLTGRRWHASGDGRWSFLRSRLSAEGAPQKAALLGRAFGCGF